MYRGKGQEHRAQLLIIIALLGAIKGLRAQNEIARPMIQGRQHREQIVLKLGGKARPHDISPVNPELISLKLAHGKWQL